MKPLLLFGMWISSEAHGMMAVLESQSDVMCSLHKFSTISEACFEQDDCWLLWWRAGKQVKGKKEGRKGALQAHKAANPMCIGERQAKMDAESFLCYL